jgi:hypothetical protein
MRKKADNVERSTRTKEHKSTRKKVKGKKRKA